MTEDEAKTKWCPQARAMAASSSANPNRVLDGTPHRGSMCIGSACMVWRWNGPQDFNRPGFCGLAGRP